MSRARRAAFGAAACAALLASRAAAQVPSAEGVRLFEAAQYRQAKAVLEPELKANPNDATAAYYLGRIAQAENRDAEAAEYFERAIQLEPTKSEYYVRLGEAYGRQAQHASVFKQPGLAKKTKAAWEHAVQLDPNNLAAREDLIEYYLQAPGIVGGGKDKAYAEAEEIRKRDSLRGLMLLGDMYEKDKKYADAERVYLAATKEKQEHPVAQYRLAQVYAATGAYDKAFDLLDELLKADPSDHIALFLVGRTGAVSGQRLDRAEEALKEYLKITPAKNEPLPVNAHWRLGMIYEKKNDRERAKAEYQAALQLDPKHKEATAGLKRVS